MESKLIGQVYAIDKVDQFGKISHEFVPLAEIPLFPGKKLGEALEQILDENKELKKQNALLVKTFNAKMAEIVKAVNENKEISVKSIHALSEEITKERFL